MSFENYNYKIKSKLKVMKKFVHYNSSFQILVVIIMDPSNLNFIYNLFFKN